MSTKVCYVGALFYNWKYIAKIPNSLSSARYLTFISQATPFSYSNSSSYKYLQYHERQHKTNPHSTLDPPAPYSSKLNKSVSTLHISMIYPTSIYRKVRTHHKSQACTNKVLERPGLCRPHSSASSYLPGPR